MITSKVHKPDLFSGAPAEDFNVWLSKFELVSKARKWDDQRKLENLPLYLTDSAFEWFTIFSRDDPHAAANYHEVICKMKDQFLPYDRANTAKEELKHLKQTDEPTRSFLVKVRKLCYEADPHMRESEIIYHMSSCIKTSIARKIIEPPDTVEEFEKLVRKIETNQQRHAPDSSADEKISSFIRDIRNEMREMSMRVGGGRDATPRPQTRERHPRFFADSSRRGQVPAQRSQRFPNYGQSFGQQRFTTPNTDNARGDVSVQRCFKCNRMGHFARDCRAPQVQRPNGFRPRESNGQQQSGLPSLFSHAFPRPHTTHALSYASVAFSQEAIGKAFQVIDSRDSVLLPVTLDAEPTMFSQHMYKAIVDTGASLSLISSKIAENRGFQVKPLEGIRFATSEEGKEMKIVGQVKLIIGFPDARDPSSFPYRRQMLAINVAVVDTHVSFLLGMDFIVDTQMWFDFFPNYIAFGWPADLLVPAIDAKILDEMPSNLALTDDGIDIFQTVFEELATDKDLFTAAVNNNADDPLDLSITRSLTDWITVDSECRTQFPTLCVELQSQTLDKPLASVALLDTGAQMSLIDESLCHRLRLVISPFYAHPIYTPAGSILPVEGTVAVTFSYTLSGNKHRTPLVCVVMNKQKARLTIEQDVLLGTDFMKAARLHLQPFSRTVCRSDFSTPPFGASMVATRGELDSLAAPLCAVVQCMRERASKRSPNPLPKHPNVQSVKRKAKTGPIMGTRGLDERMDQVFANNINVQELSKKGIQDAKERAVNVPFAEHEISIGVDLDQDQRQQLLSLLRAYRHIFSYPGDNIGFCDIYPHSIDTGTAFPTHRMPYAQSESVRNSIREHVQELLRQGIDQPSFSPWASAPHIVPKKDGTTRMVIDYRPVNRVTQRDSYPLPNIQLCLNCLRGATIFSCIDLSSGFHQIAMASEDIPKTAFTTHDGLYEFLRLPFGLKNSPATFQRTMDKVLAQMKWRKIIVFLDDILVFSRSFDEHLTHLKECFDCLESAGLTIKPSKATFCIPGVSFLGHFIDAEGVKMQPSKLEAVKCYPRPVSLRDVRAFLGLCSYYRKFLEHFAEIAKPLSDLTKKDTPLTWTEDCEKAFQELKQRLLSFPTLHHYDPDLPVELHCDSSGHGLGAVIAHRLPDNSLHPVQYASRLLSKSEENYSTTDKESLAVIWAVTKFQMYLGKHFKIYTDHKALSWMESKERLPPRLLRFALELQAYDYEIIYKPGKLNADADALSRYPVSPPEDTEEKLVVATLSLIKGRQDRLAHEERTLLEEMRQEQLHDPLLLPIIEALQRYEQKENSTERPCPPGISKRYALINGILHRRVLRNNAEQIVMCVPRRMREKVMFALHDDVYGCHMGVAKTLARLRERFFFHDMEKYVRDYIKTCVKCQVRKKEARVPYGRLMSVLPPDTPFAQIAIDIWGPVTRSRAGMQYVVVACDYLTRYVEMKALSAATSKQVARFLLDNVIKTHGFVRRILSDRGTCFLSNVMQEFYHQCSIEKINTTPYRPQTDGLVEAFNKSLGNMISHYVSEDQKDWDKHLSIMQLAYNSSVNTATKQAPFTLLFGRKACIPLDIELNTPQGIMQANDIKEAWTRAKAAIARSQERSAKYYNASRREPDFKEGDMVLKFNPTPSRTLTNKLRPRYHQDPMKIVDCLGNNVYRLLPTAASKRKQRNIIANAEMLKHFHQRNHSSSTDIAASSSDDEADILLPRPQALCADEGSKGESAYESCAAQQGDDSDVESFASADSHLHSATSVAETEIINQTTENSNSDTITEDDAELRPAPAAAACSEAQCSDAPANALASNSTDPQCTSLAAGVTQDDQQPPQSSHSPAAAENSADGIPPVAERSNNEEGEALTAPKPAPRRSERLKAKLALPTAFTLLWLMTITEASFTKVAPIVWRVTDRPVISMHSPSDWKTSAHIHAFTADKSVVW